MGEQTVVVWDLETVADLELEAPSGRQNQRPLPVE
jgi:hypothetical protein